MKKTLLLVVAVLFLCLLVFQACSPASHISQNPNVYTRKDREAARYMEHNTKPNQHYYYNLSNDWEYRYLVKTLYRSGVNKTTNPQLFKVINEERRHPMMPMMTAAVNPDTVTHGIDLITNFSTLNQIDYNTAGLLSFPQEDSLIQAVTVISLIDPNGDSIGPSRSSFGYTPIALANLEVRTSGLNVHHADSITSIYSSIYTLKNGHNMFGYSDGSNSNALKTAVNLAPVSCVMNQPVASCPCTPPPSPVQGPCIGNQMQCVDTNTITVCMSRHSPACTYCQTGLVDNFMFPIAGYAVCTGPIDTTAQGKPAGGSYGITVTRLPNGGGCTVPLNPAINFWDSVHVYGDSMTWSLPQATFPNNCLHSGDSVLYQFSLIVKSKGRPVYISMTNARDAGPSDVKVKPIQVLSGCIAAGTLITLADGSNRPIETIDVSDNIKSNANGDPMHVDYNTIGREQRPCIRLTDDKGHSLLVTDGHPMMTPGGVVLARNLKAGDKVLTADGTGTLTTVKKEVYTGKVYNLSVVNGKEKWDVTKKNSTFFANGFLVGDHKMQQYYNYNKPMTQEEVLRRLPPEWHQDYLNSLRRTAAH